MSRQGTPLQASSFDRPWNRSQFCVGRSHGIRTVSLGAREKHPKCAEVPFSKFATQDSSFAPSDSKTEGCRTAAIRSAPEAFRASCTGDVASDVPWTPRRSLPARRVAMETRPCKASRPGTVVLAHAIVAVRQFRHVYSSRCYEEDHEARHAIGRPRERLRIRGCRWWNRKRNALVSSTDAGEASRARADSVLRRKRPAHLHAEDVAEHGALVEAQPRHRRRQTKAGSVGCVVSREKNETKRPKEERDAT